ncbi:MAG: hypothetical protein JST68_26135 [Bacteroidetes bacterium]|nr:hypothetical protein [Bacteroidota bacterium]
MKVFSSLALAATLLVLSPACKKNSGNDGGGGTTSSEYYLSATVNGKAWNANTSNNSMHTPVLAAQTGSGSSTVLLVLGIQAAGKDSSAFAIVFPKSITLNKTYVFNPSQYMAGIYAPSAVLSYATSSNTNSDDSLTITSFDQSAKIIEGKFKGTFYLQSGTGATSVKITDGKFRTPYVLDASQLPPSNIKY